MTPFEWEGAVLGNALALVVFALVIGLLLAGYIRLEWHLSAKDREKRHGRIEW